MSKKIIFFDRDGVINEDDGYAHKIKDFKFNVGIFDVMNALSDEFEFIIITNQSGIGRGFYTTNDFDTLTQWMIIEFKKRNIDILDTFFCPHTPDDNCDCRKPKTEMIKKACLKYSIDLEKSWFIGDNISDMECAINANIANKIFLSNTKYDFSQKVYFINNIKQSLEIIKNNMRDL